MPPSLSGTPLPLSIERLVGLLGAAQQGIGIFDERDTLVYANDHYRQMLHLAADSFPTWKQIMRDNHRREKGTRIASPDFEAWLTSAASRRGKLPFRTFEADMHDNRWLHVAETTVADGWMLCVLTDITELATDERSLRQQRDLALRAALSDALTGLSNRRHMQETLQRLEASGERRSSAIVVLDIDHFKRVNDSFGHAAGDLLLRHFATLLQSEVRQKDLACRWGGEEFMLLLRDVGDSSATPIIERIFHSVRHSTPVQGEPGLRYTCSAGLAFVEPGEAVEQALTRADEALYAAKSGGRDRWARR